MTCQDMSCEFDSSGGAFPDGYCIWEQDAGGLFTVISCHCREGYCCGSGPTRVKNPVRGQRYKIPCVPEKKPQE